MDRRGAQPLQGGEMGSGGITLVPRQAITGIVLIELVHLAVTRHLGQNRCSHDRRNQTISLNDCFTLATELPGQPVAVDQRQCRCGVEQCHRPRQTDHAGVKDVVTINLLDRDPCHREGDGMAPDLFGELFATLFAQSLGVIETGQWLVGVENHRSGKQVATQRSGTGFIGAGDPGGRMALQQRFESRWRLGHQGVALALARAASIDATFCGPSN